MSELSIPAPTRAWPELRHLLRRFGRGLLTSAAQLATLCIAFNATVYAATTGMSTLIADSWYFVESFLMPYYEHGLDVGTLLAKRSAVDHAVPIQKLILLADARLFGLDFRMEGLFGVLVGLATLAMAAVSIRRLKSANGNDAWAAVSVTALTAVYMSMNAPGIFEWPLVSLYFVTMLFVFAFFASVAFTLDSGSYWLAALCSFACLLCVDDVGVLAWLTAVAIVGLSAARREVSVRRALGTVAAIGVGLVASRLIYTLYAGAFAESAEVSAWARVSAVLGLGVKGLAEAAVIVLSAPVIHRGQLPGAPDGLQWIQVAIAIVIAALHVWFWVSQWHSKPTFLGRLAAAVMLFAYLLVAGILYGRVSDFGLDYLNSPRYVQFYGLALVALVLQLQVAIANSAHGAGRWPKAMLFGMAFALVGLQAVYIKAGWQRAPYVAKAERQLVAELSAAADPKNAQPIACHPQMVICRRPYAQRAAVLTFLRSQQLNVFSPRFQAMRRLSPDGTAND